MEGHHADIITSLQNAASLYSNRGRYDTAEHLYRKVIDILQEQLGDQHPTVTDALRSLAEIYREQGRYGESNALFQQVLDIYEEQSSDQYLALISELSNSSYTFGESELLFIRRLEAAQKYGDKSQIFLSLQGLAGFYLIKGCYEESVDFYHQALDVLQESSELYPSISVTHSTAEIFESMALIYLAQENYSDAEHFAKKNSKLVVNKHLYNILLFGIFLL